MVHEYQLYFTTENKKMKYRQYQSTITIKMQDELVRNAMWVILFRLQLTAGFQNTNPCAEIWLTEEPL